MRVVIQRVTAAKVVVDNELVNSIGKGLCVLVGISRDDTIKDVQYMVRKVLNMRIWDGDDGKRWMLSAKDKSYELLCISQFTLYCKLKGNRPDFHMSMAPEQSKLLYEDFLSQLRRAYKPDLVKEGRFGVYCQVSIENDGPFTMQLDSRDAVEEPKAADSPKDSTNECKPDS